MSDAESVSSAASSPNLVDMLSEVRDYHKKMDTLLKDAEKMSKKVKVRARKPAGEKKPRKMSEGQLRWQAFQKYVWAEMKKENPTTIYKEAMRTAGEWKKEGYLADGSKTLAKFEAWLKANPIPSEEERLAAKQEKASSAKTKTKARNAESAAAAAEAAASEHDADAPAKAATPKKVAATAPATPKKVAKAEAKEAPPAPKKAAGRPKKA
jgi:hypothetical protein